ncbi:hypothetical protein EPUS_01302 [Endocarpon pusillum Z07020]|uniref:Uncharacterized protein n=1 Tax=Endocarpon pusillum (strain Z07020 / HMAS-L-300199) TaxID=1263415 RepID=U1GV60_ENDPU|nr:uncharacterized protein EPUS_01302 [Endocarpon pusillum Z07020]ERF75936.1 hypothetical protein EPUS_01302 [Endocarpon pusillum Z07020]
MVPRQAPTITGTPPTPIEPQEKRSLRSRSSQFLDTFVQEARSRSSSASSRHSKSSDGVKDVIANLGLAAGTVGAEHIKPPGPSDEDMLEGVRVFLSGFQNIIRRAKAGHGDNVEIIEVDDDAKSVHNPHPITQAERNPFGTSTDENADQASAAELQETAPEANSTSHRERRESYPRFSSMYREASFGEFVEDIQLEKGSGEKMPGRARLDTGMTRNAVSHSVALMLGYPIEEYTGDPCIVADGTEFSPLGQVVLPFHFVNFQTAKTWHIEFIVFPDESPFDVCLGRRFISQANLLKRNPEALPVAFGHKKSSEQQDIRIRTYQADYRSGHTKEKQDDRYVDRRSYKTTSGSGRVKDSKKWDPTHDKQKDGPTEDLTEDEPVATSDNKT